MTFFYEKFYDKVPPYLKGQRNSAQYSVFYFCSKLMTHTFDFFLTHIFDFFFLHMKTRASKKGVGSRELRYFLIGTSQERHL